MTKQQTIQILGLLSAVWSNFEVSEGRAIAWHEVFKEADFNDVKDAVITFSRTGSEKAFPPSPPEIFLIIEKEQARIKAHKLAEQKAIEYNQRNAETNGVEPEIDDETKAKLDKLLGRTGEKCAL